MQDILRIGPGVPLLAPVARRSVRQHLRDLLPKLGRAVDIIADKAMALLVFGALIAPWAATVRWGSSSYTLVHHLL